MAAKGTTIQTHRLDESTDEGFQLEKVFWKGKEDETLALGSHRDDHYLFFVQLAGMSKGMVDFESFTMLDNMAFYILPGQVHSYEAADVGTTGWFLALDPGLVPDGFRAVLENPLLAIRPLELGEDGAAPFVQCLELALRLYEQPAGSFSRQAVYSLLSSFTALFADLYSKQECISTDKASRTQIIMLAFKRLLLTEYKRLKSPVEYAAALHLSTYYLSEAVKETTGFPVSFWIQRQIVLEAKRLLYYSQRSVKEIAHELGYEDHTYFMRLFKKAVGRTPLAFRTEFGPAKPRH